MSNTNILKTGLHDELSHSRPAEARMPPPGVTGPARTSEDVDDAKTLAAGAGMGMFGRISGRGLQMLVQISLARFLGPDAFGLYALAWTILRLGKIIGGLGLERGLLRYGPAYWEDDRPALKGLLSQTGGFSLLAAVGLGLVMNFFAPGVARHLLNQPGLADVLPWLAVALPLAVLLTLIAAGTRISKRLHFSVITEDILQPGVQLAMVFLLCTFGWGLTGGMLALTLSFIPPVLLGAYFLHQMLPELGNVRAVRKVPSGELLTFSLQASLGVSLILAFTWVDKLMVGYFRPPGEVGIYQVAAQIAIVLPMIHNSFSAIIWPLIAECAAQDDHTRMNALYKTSTRWGLYVSVPLAIFVFLSTDSLIHVLFGEEFMAAALALKILVLGQIVNAASGPVTPLLVMAGHQKTWFGLSSAVLVINLGLNLTLIPKLGLLGAAISTTISIALVFTLCVLAAFKLLQVQPYDRSYVKVVLAGLAAIAVLVPLQTLGAASHLGNLIQNLAGSFAVFYLVLSLLPIDTMEKEILLLYRRKLRRLLPKAIRTNE